MVDAKRNMLEHLCKIYNGNLADTEAESVKFVLRDDYVISLLFKKVADADGLDDLTALNVELTTRCGTVNCIPFFAGNYQDEDQSFVYVANGIESWDGRGGVPEEVFPNLLTARADVLNYLQESGFEHGQGYLVSTDRISEPRRRFIADPSLASGGITPEKVDAAMDLIGKIGRGEPVDGVYRGEHFDHDGKPSF